MAGPANAETLPDTDVGTGEVDEATGLTAEEKAQFDSMRPGPGDAPAEPVGEGPAEAAGDGDDDGDDDEAEIDPAAAAPAEGKGKDAAKDDAAKPPPKTVSFGKFRRETDKLRQASESATRQVAETAAQLERERADRIKLGERLAILNEALTAGQSDGQTATKSAIDEEDIDPNVDMWKAFDQEKRRRQELLAMVQQMGQQSTEERSDANLRQTFIADAQRFGSQPETADFQNAYNYLKDTRLVEIALTEFDKDPSDPAQKFTEAEINRIVQVFNEEERWLVETNVTQKRSPAAAIYKLAKSRGYKKAEADPAANGAANGAAKPANGAARKPPVAEQIKALTEARENGKSLSDGGSTSDITTLTPERLLAMGEDEFAEYVDNLPPVKLQQLLGRELQ
jgi:hypothetical protein